METFGELCCCDLGCSWAPLGGLWGAVGVTCSPKWTPKESPKTFRIGSECQVSSKTLSRELWHQFWIDFESFLALFVGYLGTLLELCCRCFVAYVSLMCFHYSFPCARFPFTCQERFLGEKLQLMWRGETNRDECCRNVVKMSLECCRHAAGK